MPARCLAPTVALLAAVAAALLSLAGPASAAGDPVCSLYASTAGSRSAKGTVAAPLATPQQLVDALRPGETGCLRGGTYAVPTVRLGSGGSPSAPLTLMSYPGERATISVGTDVYVVKGGDSWTLRNLTFIADPASSRVSLAMIQDLANHTTWQGNDISAGSRVTCMIVGSQEPDWRAQAVGTVIDGNRIHDCGDPAQGNQQHAVYVANARGAQITNNIIWNASAYAVHLYPDADGATIAHNVIDGSGWAGIVWSADDHDAALRDDNDQAFANIITGGSRWALDVRWTTGEGTGNSAHDNCLWGNAFGSLNGTLAAVATSGNVEADPLFADAAAHDYRLNPASPCLAVVGYDTAARLAAPAGGTPRVPAEAPRIGPSPEEPGASAGTHAERRRSGVTVTARLTVIGTRILVRGTVAPAREGWWLAARRQTRSGWESIARTRLTVSAPGRSAYRITLGRARRASRIRLVVTRPGAHLALGHSRLLRLAAR